MYAKKEKTLDPELFREPTSEYRGAPFWAWNQKLDVKTLLRHMDYFKEMGMGGFHIHCRTGLDTPYLGETFMECIQACVEKAKKDGMYAYLYDEDRWPSGFAGGMVTKEKAYRSCYLVFTPFSDRYTGKAAIADDMPWKEPIGAEEDCRLLARYDVALENGFLKEYRRLGGNETGKNEWFLFEKIAEESPWFNNETYVDTLNPEAIRRFIAETHERYWEYVGKEFGETIPSIFTDEPQFSLKTALRFADSKENVVLPYTDSLPSGYEATYGECFFDTVPELIWELADGKISVSRYRFHDYIAERFASSYADVIGEWCRQHSIMLTGHMLDEPTLESQTNAVGDAMRSYRSFQLPGIDMLCDKREYTTAKQAQSAAHQYGCPGVMSEIYGVTNWDFDFRGHKLAGDWQAALGVTLRVHHLSWDSMNGEAKRDYPASIFYQSPWYQEYGMIEDHFARLNTALTRGTPHVRIAVIHPIESYWLHYGPKEQTALAREELENRFGNITEWLLFSQLDFDFVAESLLAGQFEASNDGKFHVGQMQYDAVIVPGCETLRKTTLNCLCTFKENGGDIVFMGDAPQLIDAVPSDEGKLLSSECRKIGFSKSALVKAMQSYRDVELRTADGMATDHLLYQMRKDGQARWLFVCNGKTIEDKDIPHADEVVYRLQGYWNVDEYDTMTGEIRSISVKLANGVTEFSRVMYDHSSVLLKLMPESRDKCNIHCHDEKCSDMRGFSRKDGLRLPTRMPYVLSEPNVLLLDMAEYRFDGGPWQEAEEILRLDNKCRETAGYPLRMEAFAQPWIREKSDPEHTLELRFWVDSEIDVDRAWLALEGLDATTIRVNGEILEKTDDGFFVDECIRKVPLPTIKMGRTEILLSIEYACQTNVEWCYLLGDFGVRVSGSSAVITALPEQICFGDYTVQGFPFYAGNMIYKTELVVPRAGRYLMTAEKFRSPLLKVLVDGEAVGRIALSPYQVELGHLEPGKHDLSIISYGNRINAFGAVHDCDEQREWCGPNAWRTSGAEFSYEYQLKRMGILSAPRVFSVE